MSHFQQSQFSVHSTCPSDNQANVVPADLALDELARVHSQRDEPEAQQILSPDDANHHPALPTNAWCHIIRHICRRYRDVESRRVMALLTVIEMEQVDERDGRTKSRVRPDAYRRQCDRRWTDTSGACRVLTRSRGKGTWRGGPSGVQMNKKPTRRYESEQAFIQSVSQSPNPLAVSFPPLPPIRFKSPSIPI